MTKTKTLKKIDPDVHFRVFHLLEKEPNLTQRELAERLDISLGGVNYFLKALIDIGHIKAGNFKKNPDKSLYLYLYLLTPKGISEKAHLTAGFLKRKITEYHALKQKIESIQSKANRILGMLTGISGLEKARVVKRSYLFLVLMLFIVKSVCAGPDVLGSSSWLEQEPTSLKYMAQQLAEGGAIKDLYRDMPFKFNVSPNFCPNLNSEYVKRLDFKLERCFSIAYEKTNYKTYAILLSQQKTSDSKNQKLVINNNGHSTTEKFATIFLQNLLNGGYDVLLTSMPFSGVDMTNNLITLKTWDGLVEFDPTSMTQPHNVFEVFDTGKTHYMRFFLDSAIVSTVYLKDQYNYISYVGFSGGALTGLYVCNALQSIIKTCSLVAGVMPLNFKLTSKNFGDAEQVSASFYREFRVYDLIDEIYKNKYQKLYLIYNDNDPCCFDKKSANLFRDELLNKSYSERLLIIKKSNLHNFDPNFIKSLVDENY